LNVITCVGVWTQDALSIRSSVGATDPRNCNKLTEFMESLNGNQK